MNVGCTCSERRSVVRRSQRFVDEFCAQYANESALGNGDYETVVSWYVEITRGPNAFRGGHIVCINFNLRIIDFDWVFRIFIF